MGPFTTMDLDVALEILGVPANAPQEQVREAYVDLAKVWHPDRFGGDPRLRAKAEEKLKSINEAYQFLQRVGTRRPYVPPSTSPRASASQSGPRDPGAARASE